MAIIRSLELDRARQAQSRGETAADYNMDDQFFSIWTYKNGDLNRTGDCPQNLQMDRQIAEKLYVALGEFLKK